MGAEPTPLAVRLRGVSATYGVRRVLDGVDLDVGSGELVALLGPNGSGKTTMLRIMAGVLRPSGGTVELFGRSPTAWGRREVARTVAVLPQSSELPDGFLVEEVVNLGRIPHARRVFGPDPDDERAVADALRDADADELAGRRANELSGGERQRVLLALALAQEPRLLLLDEPTLHLDLAHQLALVGLVRRLRAVREVTVVAVLHDLNLAAALADRIVLLQDGRTVAAGARGGMVDPEVAQRVFGVPVEEAISPSGRRVLVPVASHGDRPPNPRR